MSDDVWPVFMNGQLMVICDSEEAAREWAARLNAFTEGRQQCGWVNYDVKTLEDVRAIDWTPVR